MVELICNSKQIFIYYNTDKYNFGLDNYKNLIDYTLSPRYRILYSIGFDSLDANSYIYNSKSEDIKVIFSPIYKTIERIEAFGKSVSTYCFWLEKEKLRN
jgi:hypothetical protein